MAKAEETGSGEPDDEALHEQSRAQLERLRQDPKAQQLLQDLEGELGPGEDPAYWEVASSPPQQAPAPASELAEHHAGVRPAAQPKPDDDGQPYRIPTLREVFGRYEHDLEYFVELKPCNVPTPGVYEEAVVRLIRHFGLEQHVMVVSFSMELLPRVWRAPPCTAISPAGTIC